MKNVIYHEGQWSPEKDSLGFTGDMVKTAKSITATLLDAHNAIERNDADNVCSFYFDSAKRKSTNNTFEDIEDKYNFLKNHCNKIGRAVVDQIDMPFYKNIDSFSQGLENIDMQNFSVDNSVGVVSVNNVGQGPRTYTPRTVKYMDIMSSSSVFDKILTSEYDLWKSQINEEDAARVTFDQYRKAVSYVGDYDYKSIRDKQIGRELVFKIGVYTVAAIVAVPCVLTGNAPGALLSFSVAGYVCGSTSVTGAITGTNPISGRTISSDERWVEGISGGVQVLSGAYGIYTYAPPAFLHVFNTPSPTIGSIADIVDDVAKEGSDVGRSVLDKKLINELAESGVKYNADDVVMITKNANGKLLWLEKGNSYAGLKHIVDGHAADFTAKGISSNQLPDFMSTALSKGNIVGMQGTRPIYEVMYNGNLQRVAITVGSNGFIVGANPVSLP